jgi:hypothetical protein
MIEIAIFRPILSCVIVIREITTLHSSFVKTGCLWMYWVCLRVFFCNQVWYHNEISIITSFLRKHLSCRNCNSGVTSAEKNVNFASVQLNHHWDFADLLDISKNKRFQDGSGSSVSFPRSMFESSTNPSIAMDHQNAESRIMSVSTWDVEQRNSEIWFPLSNRTKSWTPGLSPS